MTQYQLISIKNSKKLKPHFQFQILRFLALEKLQSVQLPQSNFTQHVVRKMQKDRLQRQWQSSIFNIPQIQIFKTFRSRNSIKNVPVPKLGIPVTVHTSQHLHA